MSIKIYVGNLSLDSTEGELQALFEAYGKVDCAEVIVRSIYKKIARIH